MTRRKPDPVPLLTDVEIPDVFAGLMQPQSTKRRNEDGPRKSVAFGACPGCSANRIGLVRQGAHLAWRDHNYRTHGGTSIQCTSVGQHLCQAPARDVSSLVLDPTPTCPCESTSNRKTFA